MTLALHHQSIDDPTVVAQKKQQSVTF